MGVEVISLKFSRRRDPFLARGSRAVAARRLTRSLLSRSLSEGNVRLSQRTVPPGILSIADEVIE